MDRFYDTRQSFIINQHPTSAFCKLTENIQNTYKLSSHRIRTTSPNKTLIERKIKIHIERPRVIQLSTSFIRYILSLHRNPQNHLSQPSQLTSVSCTIRENITAFAHEGFISAFVAFHSRHTYTSTHTLSACLFLLRSPIYKFSAKFIRALTSLPRAIYSPTAATLSHTYIYHRHDFYRNSNPPYIKRIASMCV